MHEAQNININEYIYDLPESRIPKFPLSDRSSSKLLIYKNASVQHKLFSYLPNLIDNQSLLVFNNTRVIHARLHFYKTTGALIEIFCLEPVSPSHHLLALQQKGRVTWRCIVGNFKKWKSGDLSKAIEIGSEKVILKASVIEKEEGSVLVEFTWDEDVTFSEILTVAGNIPIPPYLNRNSEEKDKETYQTVYAEIDGSVAAPTAGLHFTNKVMDELKSKGVELKEVTLHVGAGTFQPVKSETIGEHKMHYESIFVTTQLIESLLSNKGKVVAVGTTSVRTLESLYWLGVRLIKGLSAEKVEQWDPYTLDGNISTHEALNKLLDHLRTNSREYLSCSTGIIIAPGYDFKIVEIIITNFHQPRSTLLLLISAFVGNDWRKIYNYALENKFRFLSYGDSSILFRD